MRREPNERVCNTSITGYRTSSSELRNIAIRALTGSQRGGGPCRHVNCQAS